MKLDLTSLVPLCALAACAIPSKVASDASGPGGDDAGADAGDGGATDGRDSGSGSGSNTGSGSGALALTLTGKPPALGTSTTATFTYDVNEPATIECRLDAQPYASCAGTMKSFASLADGAHTFDLRATAGADQAAIPTYSFTIDTTGPALVIVQKPPPNAPSTSAMFTFTTGDATTASITCQIGGGNAQPCSSPFSASGLPQGSNGFVLRGADALGNTAMLPYSWNVDTVIPVVTLGSTPSTYSTTKTPAFTFSATEGTTTCSIDHGTAVACASGVTFGPLAEGAHNLVVYATDAAGNQGSASYSWTVDTVAPSVGTPSYTCSDANSTATFFWSASDATSGLASVTCNYAGTPYNCIGISTITLGQQLSGSTFSVTAVDNAGLSKSNSRTITLNATLCQ